MSRSILGLFLVSLMLLEVILAQKTPPGRKKALQKEKKEFKRGLKKLDAENKVWRKSWDKTKNYAIQKLSKDERDFWRKLSEFPDDEDDNTAKRSVKESSRRADSAKILSRTKRTGELIPRPRRERMEWRRMTPERRQSFITAFNEAATFIPDPDNDEDTTAFNIFVRWHRRSSSPGAHRGASFLPWHREYLWRFSNALRFHGYRGDLPYFDSSLDQRLPNPRDSAIFIEHPLGIGISVGELGAPFNASVTTQLDECANGGPVTRNARSSATATNLLYSRTRYNIIMSKQCYHHLTVDWDRNMEGFHNAGHVFVGGTMGNAACSPGDPLFWLHHCNVDCLWEDYRQARQNPGKRTLEYPLENIGADPPVMAWNSIMLPFDDWGLFNIHGLGNHYGSYYYRCLPRPSDRICTRNRHCSPRRAGTPMLWCDRDTGFCTAKIREGGQCNTDWPNDQCFCLSGTPQCTAQAVCTC